MNVRYLALIAVPIFAASAMAQMGHADIYNAKGEKIGTAMLAKPGNDDLQMTGPLMKGAMLATEVALGMRKGETDLKEKFDAAIKSAAQAGVIRSLSQKWSKLDLTPTFDAN